MNRGRARAGIRLLRNEVVDADEELTDTDALLLAPEPGSKNLRTKKDFIAQCAGARGAPRQRLMRQCGGL